MDRLTSMSVFARVLELRSFTAAARDLGVSQATVSKHVQTLEEWLGWQLLTRTTRRVAPTREGEGFYIHCRRIMDEIDDVRVETAGAPLQGHVRLSLAAGLTAAFLGSALGRLIAAHPGLSVHIVLTSGTQAVVDSSFDALLSLGEAAPEGFFTRQLARFPLILCASPAYLARRGHPQSPAELSTHDCLISTEQDHAIWRFQTNLDVGRNGLAEGGAGGTSAVVVKGRLASRSVMMLRDAAIADAGILLTPFNLVATDILAGRLVPVLPASSPAAAILNAVYAPDRQLSARLHGVLDALSTALSVR